MSAEPQEHVEETSAPVVDATDGATVPMRTRIPNAERDRGDPDPWDTMLADPTLEVDKAALELAVKDMRRWTRKYLKPTVRLVSLFCVWAIVTLKRLLPFQFRAHGLIDVLCLWFSRRFVSVEAMTQLIRHFVVETKLINFVIDNSGASDIERCDLVPVTMPAMAERTVIRHDLNIYNFILDLGNSVDADVLSARPLEELDFQAVGVPHIDVEPERRRWINLDIETGLYLMNIPFCLFTTEAEYERAVNSFQLDESLLGYLANLTGDPVFRTWVPNKFIPWLGINRDVPRDLYWHAIVNEYAHTRLQRMAEAKAAGRSWPLERRGGEEVKLA
jgi:hypothetical protein